MGQIMGQGMGQHTMGQGMGQHSMGQGMGQHSMGQGVGQGMGQQAAVEVEMRRLLQDLQRDLGEAHPMSGGGGVGGAVAVAVAAFE